MLRFRHMPFGSIIGTGNCIFRHYGEEQTAYPDYLCFTAEEVGSTVRMAKQGPAPTVSLEYSTDRENWSEFTVGSTVVTLANIGDKVYLRGNNTRFGAGNIAYNYFIMTGKIAANGNIMSLFDKTCQSVAFSEQYACFSMFKNCASLTAAPDLPATTLNGYCYSEMFENCTALTTAPDLLATTLLGACYSYMFQNCENLQYIKVGFTRWGPHTMNWVYGVSPSGTFVCPSGLQNMPGAEFPQDSIPYRWTVETF